MALTHQPNQQPKETQALEQPKGSDATHEAPHESWLKDKRVRIGGAVAALVATIAVGAGIAGGEEPRSSADRPAVADDDPRRGVDRPITPTESQEPAPSVTAAQSPESTATATESNGERPVMPIEPSATQLAEVARSPITLDQVLPYVNTELAAQLSAEYTDIAEILSDEVKAKAIASANPEEIYSLTKAAYDAFTDEVIVSTSAMPAMPTYEAQPWSSSSELANAIAGTRIGNGYTADSLYDIGAPVSTEQMFSFMYIDAEIAAGEVESFYATKAENRPFLNLFTNAEVIDAFSVPIEGPEASGERLFVTTVMDIPTSSEPGSPIKAKVASINVFSSFPEGTYRISDGTRAYQPDEVQGAKMFITAQRVIEISN